MPEERAAEADETWSSEIKRKQRSALRHTNESEDEDSYEFYAEEGDLRPQPSAIPIRSSFRAEPQEPAPAARPVIRSSFRSSSEEPAADGSDSRERMTAFAPDMPVGSRAPEAPASKYCPHCGEQIDADSAFCIYCGKRA